LVVATADNLDSVCEQYASYASRCASVACEIDNGKLDATAAMTYARPMLPAFFNRALCDASLRLGHPGYFRAGNFLCGPPSLWRLYLHCGAAFLIERRRRE
jgi:hypothetical protein